MKKYEGIEEINFAGWHNSYKLANRCAELVVVPQIGRATAFQLPNGPNVFQFYEDYSGTSRKPTDKYIGFGGLYTWLAPQKAWSLSDEQKACGMDTTNAVPPLDGLAHEVIELCNRAITITLDDAHYGIGIEKRYIFHDSLPEFTYSVKVTNKSNITVRWAVWNLAAVKNSGSVIFAAQGGWHDMQFLFGGTPKEDGFACGVSFDSSRATIDTAKVSCSRYKLFCRPYGGFLVHSLPQYSLIRKFAKPDPQNQMFTDNNSQIEIYAESQIGLLELEVLSPEVVLESGGSYVWTETFSICSPSQGNGPKGIEEFI